jgi:hypothetical protein
MFAFTVPILLVALRRQLILLSHESTAISTVIPFPWVSEYKFINIILFIGKTFGIMVLINNIRKATGLMWHIGSGLFNDWEKAVQGQIH